MIGGKHYIQNHKAEEYSVLNAPKIKIVNERKLILENEIQNQHCFDFINKVLVQAF